MKDCLVTVVGLGLSAQGCSTSHKTSLGGRFFFKSAILHQTWIPPSLIWKTMWDLVGDFSRRGLWTWEPGDPGLGDIFLPPAPACSADYFSSFSHPLTSVWMWQCWLTAPLRVPAEKSCLTTPQMKFLLAVSIAWLSPVRIVAHSETGSPKLLSAVFMQSFGCAFTPTFSIQAEHQTGWKCILPTRCLNPVSQDILSWWPSWAEVSSH